MFEATSKRYLFKMKEIWYAEKPYDIRGYDIVQFYFVRQEPQDNSFIPKKSYFAVIALNKTMEAIYRSFDRTTQKEIRRARRENFKVETNEDYEGFAKLWNEFMSAKKIKKYELSESMLHMHPDHRLVNVKDAEGRILAADYACIAEKQMYMLYIINAIGTIPGIEDKVSMATRLAHYTMIEEALKDRLQKINLRSLGDGREEAGKKFESSFGTEREETTAYVKVYNPVLKLFYR